MKLKNYEELSLVIVSFATEDVIRTSGEEYGSGWDDLFEGFSS
jgi:hypothetical protein